MSREETALSVLRQPYLSVLMPCRNEADLVAGSLTETLRVLRTQFDSPFEIVLVDDGSTDETLSIASHLAAENPEIRVIRLPHNGGKGSALRQAFAQTKGEFVCFLDGDLEVHPQAIVPFVRALEADSVHVMVGSKRHPESQVAYPWHRRALSKAYGLFVQSLFHLGIHDTQAGIKVFRREVLARIFPMALVKRYAFDVELLALAQRLGYKITEGPIVVTAMNGNGSGVNGTEVMQMMLDTLGVFYRLRITHYYERFDVTDGIGRGS